MSVNDWEIVESELEKDDHTRLHNFLLEKIKPITKITKLVNNEGHNLLHRAALKETTGKISMIINLCKKGFLEDKSPEIEKEQVFLDWINAKTT